MIKTLGELISRFLEHEKPRLAEYSSLIEHPTMIGDMYEGLTREIASRALPSGSDLRVVKGKIATLNPVLAFSKQIDCMIVEGEGAQLPFSQDWIYPVDKVIMIVEVKKSLYKGDLIESLNLFSHFFHHVYEPKTMVQNLLFDAWRSIYGTNLPSKEDLEGLDGFAQALYHSLVLEANMPVRVVIGYEGYKTEKSLREGLVGVFEERRATSPVSLPSLIVCGDSSLLKFNGMPYGAPVDPIEKSWPFYGSRSSRSIQLFLELLWTRLSYYHGYSSSVFGDDLDLEAFKRFLDGRPALDEHNVHIGWHIDVCQPADIDSMDETDIPWTPQVITEVEYAILTPLCQGKDVLSTDVHLLEYLAQSNTTVQDVADSLKQKRLAYLNGQIFRLLAEELKIAFVSDLGCVAADDYSGRFTRWLKNRGLTPFAA